MHTAWSQGGKSSPQTVFDIKTGSVCCCWDTCSSFLRQMIDLTDKCIIIVTSLAYTNDEELFHRKKKYIKMTLITATGGSHSEAIEPGCFFLCKDSFLSPFSYALSFQCHWLLYARYKKQCMANEAHNREIWLTCWCRGVKKGGREGEERRREKIQNRKRVGYREKRCEEEKATGRWWPVPHPIPEAVALASAGTVGIRWHATWLSDCGWSRLDWHTHAGSKWRGSAVR